MNDRVGWARPAVISGLIGGPMGILCCCIPALIACICFPVKFVLPGLIAGFWVARSAARDGKCAGADLGAMAGLLAGLIAGSILAAFDSVLVFSSHSEFGRALQEEAARGSGFLGQIYEAQRDVSPLSTWVQVVVINLAASAVWSTLAGIGALLIARRSSGGGGSSAWAGPIPATGERPMRDVTPSAPPPASPPPDLPLADAEIPPEDSPPPLNADEQPPETDPREDR